MAIQIDKRFVVEAPVDRVWAYLTDPYRVAGCLPGAAITHRDGMTYTGSMKVKLGPVSSTYEGTVHFDRMDVDARTAALSAEGRDTRGKGAADMTMTSKLSPAGNGTEVHVVSDVNVTGVLAQLGRGMVEDVSDQLFEQFSSCMKATLESESEVEDETSAAAASESTADSRPPVTPVGSGAGGSPAASSPPAVSHPTSTPPVSHPTSSPPPGTGGRRSRSEGEEGVLDLGSVGSKAAARAGKRLLTRPAFWLAVALLGVLGWFVMS